MNRGLLAVTVMMSAVWGIAPGLVINSLAQSSLIPKRVSGQLPAHYVLYEADGTIYAQNGSTGAIDYSGTDACLVVNQALRNAQSSCGLILFKNGIYNCKSLIKETAPGYTNVNYAFSIPPDTGAPGQQCEWHIEGESMTNGNGWENAGSVQTNGVILKVTEDAINSVDPGELIAGFWQRPNTHGMQGNQDFFKDLTMRFPSNQRGNEIGFYPLVASTVDYENVLADFDIPYCSLKLPVAGTIGSIGITSTQSEQGNFQGFRNTAAVGWDTCYSLMSEHIEGGTLTAANCRYAGKVGDALNGNKMLVLHPGRIDRFVDQETVNGLVFGSLMVQGSMFNIDNYDMETTTSSTYSSPPTMCPNLHTFARSSNLSEMNPGFTAGVINYTHVQAWVGIVADPTGALFTSGGDHFLVRQSTSSFAK